LEKGRWNFLVLWTGDGTLPFWREEMMACSLEERLWSISIWKKRVGLAVSENEKVHSTVLEKGNRSLIERI
jgi:hypothetical protein